MICRGVDSREDVGDTKGVAVRAITTVRRSKQTSADFARIIRLISKAASHLIIESMQSRHPLCSAGKHWRLHYKSIYLYATYDRTTNLFKRVNEMPPRVATKQNFPLGTIYESQ
jgi:hypothetical protein